MSLLLSKGFNNNTVLTDILYLNSYIYAVGYTSYGGLYRPYIVKMDTSLNVIAQKIYLTTYSQIDLYKITTDGSNLFVIGQFRIDVNQNFVILKLDLNLVELAQKNLSTIEISNEEYAIGIYGSYIYIFVERGGSSWGLYMFKLDLNLNIIARNRIYSPNQTAVVPYSVCFDGTYIYMSGYFAPDYGNYYFDALIIKIDTNLVVQTKKRIYATPYVYPDGEAIRSIIYYNGYFYAVGGNGTFEDRIILKISSDLTTIVAQKEFTSTADIDKLHGIVVLNGYLYIVGADTGNHLMIKMDTDLNIIQAKKHLGLYRDYAVTTDGTYIYAVGDSVTETSVREGTVTKISSSFPLYSPIVSQSGLTSMTDKTLSPTTGNKIIVNNTWLFETSHTLNFSTSTFGYVDGNTNTFNLIYDYLLLPTAPSNLQLSCGVS